MYVTHFICVCAKGNLSPNPGKNHQEHIYVFLFDCVVSLIRTKYNDAINVLVFIFKKLPKDK